ncbi:LysR family transcriptional regulator [Infirmifilum lucidum]|uniref:LysR family transcriptional regulator n=1 Tax=Infirmifilum lucidum TaxID=2776706 RepID=A0A7L9FH70_9CREN|nr:substrate-binding domain-containing protein [Infirmifilum lucidum]QOJ79109.1 LysR family transcriptional regulator [Infirmifilum lucidum]
MSSHDIASVFDLLGKVSVELVPLLRVNGHAVTLREILVLDAVSKAGSLKRAALLLGVDYRTVWNTIDALEKTLGLRLVGREAGGAGGGGAHLTLFGEALLAKAKLVQARLASLLGGVDVGRPDVIIAGSDCEVMDRLVTELAEKGVYALYLKVGSTLGVEALKKGLCQVAGVHILDPKTGKYNEHLLSDPELRGRVVLVKGWKRVQGLAFNPRIPDPPGSLAGVVERGLTVANRVKGSGTRILLEYLLERTAKERGVPLSTLKRRLKGYDTEYTTHDEAASAVAAGRADVTLTVEWVARRHGLVFRPLVTEEYDLLVERGLLDRLPLRETTIFKGGITVVQ